MPQGIMPPSGSTRSQHLLIDYEVAGLGDRIIAFAIDMLLLTCYLAALVWVHFSVQQLPLWLLVLLLLPVVFYFLVCELLMQGRSLGKRLRHLKVVKMDGTTPGPGNYFLRWLLWPLDNMPYGAVAVITILVTGRGRRLGDLAAGTTVVKYRPEQHHMEQLLRKAMEKEYELQFPQVRRLSKNEVALIRQTLREYRLTANTEAVQATAEHVQAKLGIETDMPPVRLLNTLVKDYDHLHLHGR